MPAREPPSRPLLGARPIDFGYSWCSWRAPSSLRKRAADLANKTSLVSNRAFFIAFLLLLVLLLVAALLSLGVGAVPVKPGNVLEVLLGRHDPKVDPIEAAIIWDIRLPRILLGILIGGGLAVSGAAFQGLFRNPLADPFVMGASGGAALGATIAITLGSSWGAAGFSPVPLAAFVGSLLAVSVVYGIAHAGGTAPAVALLLAGAALSTLLSALVTLLMLMSDQSFHQIYGWLMGGFSGRSWPHLKASWPYLVIGPAALWLTARPLDALACGEETAQSLGLSVVRARSVIVLMATLTTAATVAAGGIIGFVGLIAPHIARLLFGSSHSRLIPASMLLGGMLMLLADGVARTALAPIEIPVGIVTSLLGGPFFLYLLKSRQRNLGGRG